MNQPTKQRVVVARGLYLAMLASDFALIVLGLAMFFQVIPEGTPVLGDLPPSLGLIFAGIGGINALVIWLKFGRGENRNDRGGGTVQ